MISILYLAKHQSRIDPDGVLAKQIRQLGTLTILENCGGMPKAKVLELIRSYQVLLTIWDSVPVPEEIADDPGQLAYICNVSGSVRPFVPFRIIEAGIPVTNWGDAPAHGVAEGAVALLLAVMKNLHAHIDHVRTDGWKLDQRHGPSSTLDGMRLGIYGFGAIGRQFAEMVRPFGPDIMVFDPYIDDVPDSMSRARSLDELFSSSEAVVIHAALTDETRGSVNAHHLAMLPDHGIIINTARGGIIDQAALFHELESGRLRAGLDVLDEQDRLDDGHPARRWRNVIFTAHQVSHGGWPRRTDRLTRMDEVCLNNLKRFVRGEALQFLMDKTRYERST